MDGSWCFLNCNWGARHVRGASQEGSSNNNSGSTGSSHHSYQGHGRRRRGSCAKENVDCRVSCGSAGSDASSVPDDVIRDPQQQNNRVIVTTTAQSCLDSRFITDSSDVDQSSDHSLIRNSREKDSPLRQLFRYASGEVLTARNGDRSSSASAQSSDRTSTGSTTTTSSLGKNDGGQSDSNGSSSGSDRGKGTPSNRSRSQNGVSGCGNGSSGESAGSAASKEGQGERDQGQQYHYQCDEFYFITDPEDHIFQHFPDDPEWQVSNNSSGGGCGWD